MNDLKVDASVEFSGWGQAFSASTEFKKVVNESTKQDKTHIESKAMCTVYDGAMTVLNAPGLNANFQAAVMALPENKDEDKYGRFFEDFGTHYTDKISMGAKYGF